MRCFTFSKDGVPTEGIPVGRPTMAGPYKGSPCVLVGEEGRGRWSTPVPLARELLVPPSEAQVESYASRYCVTPDAARKALMERPSPLLQVGATWQKGRGAMLIAHTPSDRALVLVPSLMGYRGGASSYALSFAPRYTGPDTDETLRTAWMAGRGAAQLPRVDSVSLAGAFRSTDRPTSVGAVTVLAAGVAAEGAAGNMGSCSCYLVVVEPGEGILVVRSGRLYGAPPVVAARWDGSTWSLVDHTGAAPSGPEVTL